MRPTPSVGGGGWIGKDRCQRSLSGQEALEMGHTDPGLALRVYRQAMRRGELERAKLRALVEGYELDREALAAATSRARQNSNCDLSLRRNDKEKAKEAPKWLWQARCALTQ
jgi:hypothetical protein